MSNTDIDERADRQNALDKFAASAPRQEVQVLPQFNQVERTVGAQHVAVYRDDQRVLQKLAALGAAAGDDWFYRFPVKSRDGSKSFIEGPSIKLANDLARIYGNCAVQTRVFDLGQTWMIYARFVDYETGFEMERPFQQNKGGSKLGGKGDDADARRLDIALQIGVSKAIRNVVVNALQTYADHAFDAARNSLVEKIGKDVGKWQDQMAVRLKDRGVDLQRVEYVVGRVLKDWTAPDIARVIAMMKSIADGMATLDDTFPPKNLQTADHDPTTGEVTSTEGAITAESSGPIGAQGESNTDQAAGAKAETAAPPPAQDTKTAEEVTAQRTAQTSEAGTPAGGSAPASPATQSKSPADDKPARDGGPVDNGEGAAKKAAAEL
jgi:hypothetical protein